jgi:hypothetical protein
MIIISHRGYWHLDSEKNREIAFKRSFSLGFGTETDIRDRNGELVISHDMPNEVDISFERFCEIYQTFPGNHLLAINVKADGLASILKKMLEKYAIDNYFLFDMSVPQLRIFLSMGLTCYTRISDVEHEPCFYGASQGIWLDGFYSDWYRPCDLHKFLRDTKKVCLVSSELHKRDPLPLWHMLKQSGMQNESGLILCTDRPEQAQAFFFEEE